MSTNTEGQRGGLAGDPRRLDLDDIGDITAGGTPSGTGVSGNEVPATPLAGEDQDNLEPGGIGGTDPVQGSKR
jgi:hypothetical protein